MLRRQPVLRTIDIDLTYRCPCRCEQCYSEDFKNPEAEELRADEIAEIVRAAIPLGALQVALSGGEPLARLDLPEIIAACQPKRTLVSVCTSGAGLREQRLRRLAEAGLAVLIFSLDSLDPAVHNANRGVPGLYDRVLENARLARQLGLSVVFNSVATKEKIASGEIERLADFASERGVILNLTVPAPLGRWTDNHDILLDAEERRAFFVLLRQPNVRTDTHSTYLRSGCPAGAEKISVSAYGDVRACQILPRAFGNVRRDNLGEVWARMRAHPGLGRYAAFCPAGDGRFIDLHRDLFEEPERTPSDLVMLG